MSKRNETPKEIVVGAYTPTDSEVKDAYQRGEFINKAMSEQRWQRWLRTVKAEAWAEGQQRGWMDAMESVQADTEVSRALSGVSPNPYESEEA